jgi:hypothetical protein
MYTIEFGIVPEEISAAGILVQLGVQGMLPASCAGPDLRDELDLVTPNFEWVEIIAGKVVD